MNFINFPESNLVMGSGGNENTHAIRVMVCQHPEYKQGQKFYAAKLEFDGNERYMIAEAFRKHVKETLGKELDAELFHCLTSSLPPIWLNCMHGFMPTSVHVDPPWAMGFKKIALPVSPKDN